MQTNAELYKQDFHAWTQATAALLAAGKWHEIDRALLADEVRGLGREDTREMTQRVQRILQELLLWWALPGERRGHWMVTISQQRDSLEAILTDSPSLTIPLGEVVAQEYRWARSKAQDQAPGTCFPTTCPFTVEQIRHDDFFPEGATLEPPAA